MTCVYCFSGSGHSRAVATYFARKLQVPVVDIGQYLTDRQYQANLAVVIFSVYCQNIPAIVRAFLRQLSAEFVVLVATYGKISHGNVLWEAARIVEGCVIAAAYIPMGHTYLDPSTKFDEQILSPIFDKMHDPRAVVLQKERKHPFASFFPAWRSRLGVKISRDENCDGCNICREQCPMQAIEAGSIHGGCIRCLRCVYHCPQSALHVTLRPVLRHYLEHATCEKLKING